MRVRLAFSVAAHLDPDILIVDEVLAVGDAEFQKKCLGKIGDVAQSGRTVFFVSHDLNAVMSLCNRVIWIDKGKLMDDGEPKKVVQNYIESVSTISNSTVDLLDIDDRVNPIEAVKWKGDRDFQLTQINLKNQTHSTSSLHLLLLKSYSLLFLLCGFISIWISVFTKVYLGFLFCRKPLRH